MLTQSPFPFSSEPHYLPIKEAGRRVLFPEGGGTYLVDNRELCAPTKGILYRRSQNYSDMILCAAEWGSRVRGELRGEDWLAVPLVRIHMKSMALAESLSYLDEIRIGP